MSFNLDEYVDVAERIRMFAEKFPEGSLQGDGFFVRDPEDKIIGYHYVARAYRSPSDERPGVGTAYEPIPGKTQFTRDSEVQNSETAAWGRAIVALGFNTKKIASREEVRARQGDNGSVAAGVPTPSTQSEASAEGNEADTAAAGNAGDVEVTFGKHKGKRLRDVLDTDRNYVEWLAGTFEAKNDGARTVKAAAEIVLAGGGDLAQVGAVLDDIPFAPSVH